MTSRFSSTACSRPPREGPSPPLTTYLVSIAATNYVSVTDSYATLAGGTMPIVHYVYPGTADAAVESFRPTSSMIRFQPMRWKKVACG